MTQIWHALYFLSTLFTFSDPFQALVSINELMSWIGCVRWGSGTGIQDSFENNFRDMFLNVTHIKYITCMHKFKAALIAFLVTSCLNWPRHCMHVVSFVLWYELIQATACAGAFVRATEDHAQLKITRCEYSTVFRARLTHVWRWSEAGACVKHLRFDVVLKTFCDWINALLVKKKRDRSSSCDWALQP